MAASAAKARAELKMERQASAIEKQQQKIEQEMKKIEAITEKLHRQQMREARRLRNRLEYSATRIQAAYRTYLSRQHTARTAALIEIQRHWRGSHSRRYSRALAVERINQIKDIAARVITRSIRVFACRVAMRHGLQWRAFAATVIQSAVRRYQAMSDYAIMRHQCAQHLRHERAATLIQSHTRGFLTRLVYMDVLYLVCRIQSVARGFLVRKRLQWLRSIDLNRIVKIQALVRGFLTRRQFKPLLMLRSVAPSRIGARDRYQGSMTRRHVEFLGDVTPDATPVTIGKAANASCWKPSVNSTLLPSALSPLFIAPPIVKRSYWLPSGANTSTLHKRRLPQLAVDGRPSFKILGTDSVAPCHAGRTSVNDFNDVVRHAVHIQRMVRGHLSKHRPPRRLTPLEKSSEKGGDQHAGEDVAVQHTTEDRRKREEQLKRKVQTHRAAQKLRQELDAARREQEEHEDKERKQMEREDKLTRLWVKTTYRKHLELRHRRQSMDQEREERERVEMRREERMCRLHNRKLVRLVKQPQLKRISHVDASSNDNDSGDDTAINKEMRDEDPRTNQRQNIRLRFHRAGKVWEPVPASFQNRTKPLTKLTGQSLKKTRQLRAVYGPAMVTNQTLEERNREYDLRVQYAEWNFHTDDIITQAYMVEDEAEFDYGHEFDDIVEETKLTRLLC